MKYSYPQINLTAQHGVCTIYRITRIRHVIQYNSKFLPYKLLFEFRKNCKQLDANISIYLTYFHINLKIFAVSHFVVENSIVVCGMKYAYGEQTAFNENECKSH